MRKWWRDIDGWDRVYMVANTLTVILGVAYLCTR